MGQWLGTLAVLGNHQGLVPILMPGSSQPLEALMPFAGLNGTCTHTGTQASR